jgi:hypothetical protein
MQTKASMLNNMLFSQSQYDDDDEPEYEKE